MKIKIHKKYIKDDLLSFITFENKKDFEVIFCNYGASIYGLNFFMTMVMI